MSVSPIRKRLRAADAKVARASRSMIVEERLFSRDMQALTMHEAMYKAKRRAGNKACDREAEQGDIERAQHWNLKVIEAQLDWGDDQIDFLEAKGEYTSKKLALLEAKLEQRDAKIALLEQFEEERVEDGVKAGAIVVTARNAERLEVAQLARPLDEVARVLDHRFLEVHVDLGICLHLQVVSLPLLAHVIGFELDDTLHLSGVVCVLRAG